MLHHKQLTYLYGWRMMIMLKMVNVDGDQRAGSGHVEMVHRRGWICWKALRGGLVRLLQILIFHHLHIHTSFVTTTMLIMLMLVTMLIIMLATRYNSGEFEMKFLCPGVKAEDCVVDSRGRNSCDGPCELFQTYNRIKSILFVTLL